MVAFVNEFMLMDGLEMAVQCATLVRSAETALSQIVTVFSHGVAIRCKEASRIPLNFVVNFKFVDFSLYPNISSFYLFGIHRTV
jgi:hypothetical protein